MMIHHFYRLLSQIPISLPSDSIPDAAQDLKALKSLSFDELINRMVSGLIEFAIHLAIAIVVFYAGKFIIKRLFTITATILHRRNVEQSLTTFVLSFIKILLYFILIITVIGILGINTSSFLAVFASVGVAIGMALSGTLQNFAGGVLILLLKPYRIGDYIEAQGFAGTVTEIQIFHPIICTPDNKSIIIPNGGLSTGSINNWSRQEYRRVQWDIGISYGDSFETAEKAILDILAGEPLVVRAADVKPEEVDPDSDSNGIKTASDSEMPQKSSWLRRLFSSPRRRLLAHQRQTEAAIRALTKVPVTDPTVDIASLADSSVNLTVRAWARTSDYWGLYNSVIRRIYTELPASGVSFPFPQMDVHIVSTPE